MKQKTFGVPLLSALVLLVSISSPSAQEAAANQTPSTPASATEVFDRFATAAGGREAIEKIKSRKTESTFEMPAFAVKAKVETLVKSPGKMKAVMSMDAGKMVRVFDGTKGWVSDPFSGGMRSVEGVELEDMRQEADLHLPLNLAKMFPDAKLLESRVVDGVRMHVVGVGAAGRGQTLYFDSAVGLLRRWDRVSVSPAGEIPVQLTWSDYRAVDGVQIAHAFKLHSDQFAISVRVDTCVHNQPVDDAMFAKPSAP